MNITVLRPVLALSLLGAVAYADDITVDGASRTMTFTVFGLSGAGMTGALTNTAPTPAPAAPHQVPAAPAPSNTIPSNTIVVPTGYSSTLSGSGLSYSLNVIGPTVVGGLSTNTVDLSSAQPLTYSNYLGLVPESQKITGATLNLDVLIGAPVAQVLSSSSGTPFFVPTLDGNLGCLSITIQSGGLSQTLSCTSVTGYDLFANGFGSQVVAGMPLVITFDVQDHVTATGAYASPTQTVFGGASSGQTLQLTLAEMLALSDTRTIKGGSNYLTLYVGGAQEPPVDPEGDTPGSVPTQNPEPVPAILIGSGLAGLA